MGAANLWGSTGQSYAIVYQPFNEKDVPLQPAVNTWDAYEEWWHIFVDYNTDYDANKHVVTSRTINVSATCEEFTVTNGGYAGFDGNDNQQVSWIDNSNTTQQRIIKDISMGHTTWMGNMSSDCGPRCVQILALQSANNLTAEDVENMGDSIRSDEIIPVQAPRMWQCNNTIGQVQNYDTKAEGFDDPDLLLMPNLQAKIMAGAIGWSGVVMYYDGGDEMDELQYSMVRGDYPLYNPPGNATAGEMAAAVMKFTVGAIAAMDQPNGLRQTVTGNGQPRLAQVINVKWHFAAAILGGLPVVQLLMLVAVVWFSRKAIILEPSALTTAHLLYPIMHRLGEKGVLMSAGEIEETLGGDFKVAYSVRPDQQDPGPHEKDYVRRLGLLQQSEGFGYVRGRMPTGRYA